MPSTPSLHIPRWSALLAGVVWFRVLMLGLVFIAAACPAAAAPPVITATDMPPLREYASPAKQLGVNRNRSQASGTAELYLRVSRSRGVLIASLPSGVPEEAAKRWLQHTSDELGWASPELTFHRGSGALILKLEGGGAVSQTGATSSRLNLRTEPLRASLEELSLRSVSLCVRLPGANLLRRSPSPQEEGDVSGDPYLLYPLAAKTVGTLVVEFGIPPRWPAAAGVALLLWLSAPFGAAWGARAYLSKCSHLPAEKRIALFDRWMLWSRFPTVVGLMITTGALYLNRLDYLGLPFGLHLSSDGALPVPFWFWCQGAAGMIRVRLVREALPETSAGVSETAWNLGIAVISLLLTLMPGIIRGSSSLVPPFRTTAPGAVGPPVVGWLLLAGGIILLVILLPVHMMVSRALRRIPLPALPEDPEGLSVTLREMTEETIREQQANPANLEELEKLAGNSNLPSGLRGLLALDADQQVAVGAAAQLCMLQTSVESNWKLSFVLFVPALLIVLGVWQCLRPTAGFTLEPILLGLVLIGGGVALASCFNFRRGSKRQQAIDLKVALAMDEPRRYLDALRKLAECEQHISTVMGVQLPGGTGYKQRVRQLERQLRLD